MSQRLAQALLAVSALLLLPAAAVRAGTGVGMSAPGTLDTRPPAIALGSPVEGEPLRIGAEFSFLWAVCEEHFAVAEPVMTIEILVDGEAILSAAIEAEESGEYSYVWVAQADSSVVATWRVSAADLYGNAAVAQSGPFLLTDGETGSPLGAPENISLAGNFPNPFNPLTTLRFSLPAAARIRLSVYDVRGRRVALLYDGEKEAGWHSLDWDARGRASGVYFARLETGGESLTRKLVLLQ